MQYEEVEWFMWQKYFILFISKQNVFEGEIRKNCKHVIHFFKSDFCVFSIYDYILNKNSIVMYDSCFNVIIQFFVLYSPMEAANLIKDSNLIHYRSSRWMMKLLRRKNRKKISKIRFTISKVVCLQMEALNLTTLFHGNYFFLV